MKKTINLLPFLLLLLVISCGQQNGDSSNSNDNAQNSDSARWLKEAQDQYRKLTYYYNNNIHDTLVMMVPEVLDFCREHELWTDFYDTWMLLGEEYSFSGEHSKAIKIVQEIHDDATKRSNKYGLTAAMFVKGLVYDGQLITRRLRAVSRLHWPTTLPMLHHSRKTASTFTISPN